MFKSTRERRRTGAPSPIARAPRWRSRLGRSALGVLVAAVHALALAAPAAFGEGSVNVNAGPANAIRDGLAFLNTNDSYTVLRVYARAGETIQMGSSAMGLGGGANILVYPPGTSFSSSTNPAVPAHYPTDPVFATDVLDCVAAQPGTGRVASRAQEAAGPLPNAGGYTPCAYVAPADGVYSVLMVPLNFSVNGSPGTVAAPNVGGSQGFTISIWDVTVRNAGGVVQPGRAFTNKAALRTNDAAATSTNFRAFVYACTGYLYQVDLFAQSGFNWNLASDSRGVVATATGDTLFASSLGLSGDATAPALFNPDVVQDSRHPLFFRSPDPVAISGPGGLEDERGCSPVPVTSANAPLTNVAFTGSGGQAGGTNLGSGGTISFTAPQILAGNSYGVALDLDGNGSFTDPADVTVRGMELAAGANSFAWNGLNGVGATPGCGTYNYRIETTLADVHFPMVDVENSGGTRIERLTLPTLFPPPRALSYNDINPFTGTAVTNANPSAVTNGTSGPGFHGWSANSGDVDLIDTWTTVPGPQATGNFKVLCAELGIVKTASPPPAVAGRPLTYQLVVTNNGPDDATGVTVADPLPAGLTFQSASLGCGASGQTVTCALGTIAAGASRTVTVTANVASSAQGQIVNTASVTSTTPDTNPGNNSSTVTVPLEGEADLSISKRAPSSTVGPGGQLLYTLVVENHGPSDATDVTVTDAPPAGIALQSAQASQGSCTVTPGGLTCSLGRLASGGSAQVLVTAEATADPPATLTNTASVSGTQRDPDPTNNADPETVGVVTPQPEPLPEPVPLPGGPPRADLTITKEGDRRGAVGRPLEYRIVVRNPGPATATDVTVTDTFSLPARLVSARTTAGSCQRSLPITCSLGAIEAGARVTITVLIAPREAGTARNAASVTGERLDPKTANNLAVVTTRVRPALALTKVTKRKRLPAGQTATYTIRVRNPTDVTARNVRTCDDLPAGLVYVSSNPRARLSDGRYCWMVKRLGAGKHRTYRLTARALTVGGRKINRATATARNTGTARARRAVRVVPAPAPEPCPQVAERLNPTRAPSLPPLRTGAGIERAVASCG